MKKIYGILSILLCFLMTGCDDDSNEGGLALSIVKSDVNFTAAGGNGTIEVAGNGTITSTSDQDWCTVNVSGKTVNLTVAMNEMISSRTALISIISEGVTQQIPCTQAGNRVPIPDVETVSFDANGGTLKIHVVNVMPYTVEPVDSWITTKIEGDSLVLTAPSNFTKDSRTTKVKLISGILTAEIGVSQSGITLVPESTTIRMKNTGETIQVKVKSTMPFSATSDQNWLTATPGNGMVTLVAADNSGQPERKATVTLNSQGVTATIEVTQKPILYADYLGNWMLTGKGNDGTTVTYPIKIEEATTGSTYKITGWGKSVVATDSKYAIEANFHSQTGMIFITAQENIETYTDSEGENFKVHYYGQIEMSGKIYYVSGSGYICYIGLMQPDGSVQWGNGEVELTDGNTYDVIGAKYYIENNDGGILSFNVDSPFIMKPLMEPIAAAASVVNRSYTPTAIKLISNGLKAK